MNRDQARQVITEPARLRGVTIKDDLVEQILDEIGGNEIYPPKLQIVCSELYKSRERNTSVIGKDLYLQLGGGEGILGQYFYRTLKRELSSHS